MPKTAINLHFEQKYVTTKFYVISNFQPQHICGTPAFSAISLHINLVITKKEKTTWNDIRIVAVISIMNGESKLWRLDILSKVFGKTYDCVTLAFLSWWNCL